MKGSRALRSMASGKTPAQRDQEVHTPPEILWPVFEAFGGKIALDPCAASNRNYWFAERSVTLPLTVAGKVKRWRAAWDGLFIPWVDRTYWNPPYREQGAWMEKARVEYLDNGVRSVGLGKVCTHRRYYWPNVLGCEVVYLAPVYFHDRYGNPILDGQGRRAAAPFALALFCWGVSLPPLGKLELHREAIRPPPRISRIRARSGSSSRPAVKVPRTLGKTCA